MCEKSNETDFVVTKVFIVFKQQYCPLQSSSLRQLHTGGDVFPSLGSSAERRQLVGCLICRSHDVECSPESQNDVLLRQFSIWGKEKSHKDSDQVNRGAGEQQGCVLRSKILLSCEGFRYHFGTNLSHVQIVGQNVMYGESI